MSPGPRSLFPTDLLVHDVAKRLGIGRHTLHAWEVRYGWPQPMRLPNGYRVFSPAVVAEVARVVALLRAGHRIGALIIDGRPHWPSEAPGSGRIPRWSVLAQVPEPEDRMARSYRTHLVVALKLRDAPAIARHLHMATRLLRPADRMLAAWLPAYVAAQEWARIDRALPVDVLGLLQRLAGPEVVAAARARWTEATA